MSDFNGTGEGTANDALVQAASTSGDVERRENKLRSSVDYYAREVEAAKIGVENLEAKIERLKSQVAEHEGQLEEANDRLAKSEASHAEATASVEKLGDN